MKGYLVETKSERGTYLSVLSERQLASAKLSGKVFDMFNTVVVAGRLRKGKVTSAFSGRSVRAFDADDGATYEVFADASARLAK